MEACLKDGWLQEECDRLHEQSAAIMASDAADAMGEEEAKHTEKAG